MTFDPDVRQNTRIRIAHQLQLIRIPSFAQRYWGQGLPSGAGCRYNDLSLG